MPGETSHQFRRIALFSIPGSSERLRTGTNLPTFTQAHGPLLLSKVDRSISLNNLKDGSIVPYPRLQSTVIPRLSTLFPPITLPSHTRPSVHSHTHANFLIRPWYCT